MILPNFLEQLIQGTIPYEAGSDLWYAPFPTKDSLFQI